MADAPALANIPVAQNPSARVSTPNAEIRTAARWVDWLTSAHVLAALLLGAIAVAVLSGQPFWLGIIARAAIFALAALSLSFILGQGGLVNFGHAAPFGIGAYAALIAGEYGVREVLVVLPLAAASGAAFAVVTGLLSLRTRGIYYIMITLAFAQMAFYTASSLSAFGGDDGMALAGRMTLFGARIFRTDLNVAIGSVVILWGTAIALERIVGSRFGVVLRGLKANETRMAALGFPSLRYHLVAVGISAAVAGVAGALLANLSDFVAPAYMNWHRSGELLVMVVLGGVGRIGGAIIGAIGVILLEEGIGHFTEYWKFWLGLFLVVVVLLRGGALGQFLRVRRHD